MFEEKLEEKTAEKSSVAGVFHAQHKKSMREKIRSENPQLLPSWSRSNMSKLQLQQGCARQLASKFYEQRQLCSGQWDGNIGTCLLVNALQRSDLRKEKSTLNFFRDLPRPQPGLRFLGEAATMSLGSKRSGQYVATGGK